MSEQTGAESAAGTTNGTESDAADTTDTQRTQDATDWQAEAKKWEKRAKQNHDKAQRLDQLEQSSLSAEQKAERVAEELSSVTAERDEALGELARLRAAVKYQLDDDDVKALADVHPDAVERVAARLAAKAGDAGRARKPAPDRAQGRGQTGSGSPADQFAAFVSQQF